MPSYTCTFCNKSYQRKTFYDRHIIGCELLHLSSKERQEKRDILNDIPPPLKMYEMILTLTKKVNEQEKVIEEFKNASQKNKSVPVRKWLNTNITPPTTDFDKLLRTLMTLSLTKNILTKFWTLVLWIYHTSYQKHTSLRSGYRENIY